MNEQVLVSRILAGDVRAFRNLIRENERLVAHMVGRVVKDEQEREELCQDVFMKVYERLSTFNFQSKLSTWIATIAYRHAINHLRGKRMLFSDLPDEASFSRQFVETQNPETLLEEADIDGYLLKAIDALPAQYKTILMLYHVEGMSYPEMCAVTGMPEGTVKNYLFRARKLLKDSVKSISDS